MRPSPATATPPAGGHSILDAFEILMEDEGYRPPAGGVAVAGDGLMFGEALFQVAACRADIVRAIGAAQDVEISVHFVCPSPRPSFETPLRGFLRMRIFPVHDG